jgi:hypothetical protein
LVILKMTSQPTHKIPRQLLAGIYAFSPNRETLGAVSYLIVENTGNILIDCPLWDETNRQFLINQGGVSCLFLTHRNAIGKQVKQMQEFLRCQIVIQEQEAYLLPEISKTTFENEIEISPNCLGIWSPGYSPGSCCLYYKKNGGVLFSGRHLLSDPDGKLRPLRNEKTFHWPRQLKSVELLRNRFNRDNLSVIIPAANTGYLRGKGYFENAYEALSEGNW